MTNRSPRTKEPMTTKRKVFLVIGIVVGSLVLLAGLALGGLTLFAWMLSDPVQVDPAHPVVFGVRADGDNLLISTGRECPKGTKFSISFPTLSTDAPVPRFESLVALQPVTVFDVIDPEPQLRVDSLFPDTFHVQWDQAEWIEISVSLPRGRDPFSSSLSFADLQSESLNHPGQFYFGDMGWLTTEDVAARDGVDLLTICTPRPK